MERGHRGPRSKAVFLVLLAACVVAATASSPMTFDSYSRTPPRYGAIAPTSPFTRLRYRQHPSAGFYRPRPSLLDYYYPSYHPMGRNQDPLDSYYYQPSRRAFPGRPFRGEREPFGYNPYTAFAHQWRYHSPYFATRYFQQFRPPPWRDYRPTYTYFQSAIPSYSGFVSLPSRIYYPHFSHGVGGGVGGVGSVGSVGNVGGHELRHPSSEQYLVFIPDLEEMSQPDGLTPIEIPLVAGNEGAVVHYPGMPQVDVAAPVDAAAEVDPSHGVDVTTPVSPASVAEEVVSQSEGGNEASTESAVTPNEDVDTSSEQIADHSTERPAESEWPGSEISAVTAASTQGAGISQGNEGNEGNEGEVTTEAETSTGEYPEYVTEVVDKLDNPDAHTKPVNHIQEASSESEHPEDNNETPSESEHPEDNHESSTESEHLEFNHESATESEHLEFNHESSTESEHPEDNNETPSESEHPEDNQESSTESEHLEFNHETPSESEHPQEDYETVTESVTEDTTPADQGDEEVHETEEKEATTEKAVYVQLHLLEQDAATPTPTPTPASVERRNASESNLFYLGLEMPSDQPDMEPRDRIYKRYSDNKSQAKLSLDFKTMPVKPAFV